jgi:SagB-type dehydrogenase family enzyme
MAVGGKINRVRSVSLWKAVKLCLTYYSMMKTIFMSAFLIALYLPNPNNMYDLVTSPSHKPSEEISLPSPRLSSDMSIEETLLHRRSVREFRNETIKLEDVSQILWAAYGITSARSHPASLQGGLRTAPSAGALYPLEIYLVAGKVNGLKPGIYQYKADGHKLVLSATGDIRRELAEAALSQSFITDAPASLVFSAVFSRTTGKYGTRGKERYVCMDLGHAAQNVYLQATALGLATCAVGAFTDKMVSNALMLPDNEEPLYIMPIGREK